MQQLPRPPGSAPTLLTRIAFGLAAVVAIGIAAVLISATLLVGLVTGLVVVTVAWATLRWKFWRAGLRWPPWRAVQTRSSWGTSTPESESPFNRGGSASRGSSEVIDMDLREVEPARRDRPGDSNTGR